MKKPAGGCGTQAGDFSKKRPRELASLHTLYSATMNISSLSPCYVKWGYERFLVLLYRGTRLW